MIGIFRKELNTFFSSLIGYVVIGVFLTVLGLVLFVFPDSSLLESPFATLDPLFDLAPVVFLFLAPAITMRLFAEEHMFGTMELLMTKPLRDGDIVLGKFLAALALLLFALLPTMLYFTTIYRLGQPQGNLDSGAVAGSYLGLLFLGGAFVSIGLFASSLSRNQIVAFLLATVLGFVFYYGFFYISRLPFLVGWGDDVVQMIGMDYHYHSISRGVLDSRDLVYFLSVIVFFLAASLVSLDRRRW